MELVGKNGKQEYFGQVAVSRNVKNIRKLDYDHSIHISEKVIEKIGEADLIVFSPGSLYTSILPHLLSKDVLKALDRAKAPIFYVCNIVTQPGETDGYTVGDHLRVLNRYLKTLDRTNLYIFMRKYWYFDQVPEISSRLGISDAAVYQRLARMKNSLHKYLIKQGVIK